VLGCEPIGLHEATWTTHFVSSKTYFFPSWMKFCYQLCRATDARRSVEIGTSYGVSVDLDLLPDMGRMTGRLLSGAAHGYSPAPTVAVSERLQCTP
jgi:hypothetical protein